MQRPLLQDDRSPSTCVGLGGNSKLDTERLNVQRKLRNAIILSLTLMALEIVGGLWAKSLAIITDAAHLLSDVSGFAVSLFAVALSQKQPTLQYTYGYHQAEILGAISSVLIVWAMTGILLFEAVNRFIYLEEVNGRLMLIMAVVGLIVNFALFSTLHHGHDHDHGCAHEHSHAGHSHRGHDHSHHDHRHPHTPNSGAQAESIVEAVATTGSSNLALDAAVVHIIGDTVQSVGVLLAAILIVWQPFDLGSTAEGISNWNYADPACTILFSILVMATTFRTTKQSVSVIMHRVPENVSVSDLDSKLRTIAGVQCVHDIHVWLVGSSNSLCTAHVVVDAGSDTGLVLGECKRIAHALGIGHSTFQIEVDGSFDHATESFGDLHGRDQDCCGNALLSA